MKKTKKSVAKSVKKPAARKVAKRAPAPKHAASKHEVHYLCPGNCLGLATEAEYNKGAKKCNVVVCSHYGHPLQKKHYCKECHMHFEVGKKHECFRF